MDEVRSRVDFVSRSVGGDGAAREFVEIVLKAQGRWEALLGAYTGGEPMRRRRRSAGRSAAHRNMTQYATLVALVALLAGLAIGKAWERYKLRDGKWFDRRRARESPHYLLGLNFLVANQIDLAIEELTRAATLNADALEVHMMLGNLYREKGQVGKAITVHQNLLQRPKLSRLEHAYVLLCLGLDYKRGGFVDRALEAFNEVLQLDPKNEYALAQPAEAARRTTSVVGGVRHAAATAEARRYRLTAAERGDPRVPGKRDRAGGDAAIGLCRSDPAVRGARSISTRARCRPT